MKFFKCYTFYMYIGLFAAIVQLVNCAPADYDGIDPISADMYDIDTEQSQVRYDPRLLSEDLTNYHSSLNEGAPCINSNARYIHGQKISRTDPCEICLCVDGEIFCWWKKCEYLMKKPPKKSKYHNRKLTNKWTKMYPKNILNFPKHLPFSLLIGESSSSSSSSSSNSNSNNMMHHHNKFNDDEHTSVISFAVTQQPLQSAQPPQPPLSVTSSPSLLYMPSDSTNVYIPENIFNGNTVDYATDNFKDNTNGHASNIIINDDDDDNDDNDRIQQMTITARPIVVYENRQTTNGISSSSYNNQMNSNEKGYFEKTIFNKNGIFIEKIRKIADIDDTNRNNNDNSVLLSSHKKNDNDNINNYNNDDMENINRKRIELMNVPLSQHYVITSSGKIEKTDTLASSDVIEQFRDGLNNDYQLLTTTTKTESIVNPITTTTAPTASVKSSTIIESKNMVGDTANRPTPSMGDSTSVDTVAVTNLMSSTTINNQNNGTSVADANKQELNCLVMGKTYKVGTILPQEIGNCLQCICDYGANKNESPRVTCSPHNCPPLILPDLFDASGY